MTRNELELIANALRRTRLAMPPNVARVGIDRAAEALAAELAATHPGFDRHGFLKLAGGKP